jgi:hypothetical protein
LRNLWILVGIFAATAAVSSAAGSFDVLLNVDTYVDSAKPGDSFSQDNALWASSVDGTPAKEVYLGFINNFARAKVNSPENISSATLKLYASKVEKTGKIVAYVSEGSALDTADWEHRLTYDSDIAVPFDVQGEGEYVVDATPLVKKALDLCPGECPYTIVLVAEDSASVAFASQEASPEKAPSLKYDTL